MFRLRFHNTFPGTDPEVWPCGSTPPLNVSLTTYVDSLGHGLLFARVFLVLLRKKYFLNISLIFTIQVEFFQALVCILSLKKST